MTVIGFHASHEQVHPSALLDGTTRAEHAAYPRECAELEFDRLAIHHAGHEQSAFIDAYGEHVLPELRNQ
jgi:hypothetical protein